MLKFYEMFIHPRVPPFSISYEYWMLKCLTLWVMITLCQHPAELVPPSSMTMDPKSSPTSLAEALPPSISRQIPASQHQRRHWHRRCQGEGSLPRNMFNSFKVGSSHGSIDPLNPSPLVQSTPPRDCKRWMASNHCCCWPRTPKATDKSFQGHKRGRHCTTKGFSMPVMTSQPTWHKVHPLKNHDWMKGCCYLMLVATILTLVIWQDAWRETISSTSYSPQVLWPVHRAAAGVSLLWPRAACPYAAPPAVPGNSRLAPTAARDRPCMAMWILYLSFFVVLPLWQLLTPIDSVQIPKETAWKPRESGTLRLVALGRMTMRSCPLASFWPCQGFKEIQRNKCCFMALKIFKIK